MTAIEMSYEYPEIGHPAMSALTAEAVTQDAVDSLDEFVVDASVIGEGREATDTSPWENNAVTNTSEEILEHFDRWKAGEPVPSEATPVARLPELTDAELELLRTMDSYITLSRRDVLSGLPADDVFGVTADQLTLARRMCTAFMEAVQADAHTNGFELFDSQRYHPYVRIGNYTPEANGTGWHVDLFESPAVRYVASWGDPEATNFGIGTCRRSDIPEEGDALEADVGPDGDYQLANHGTAVLSRFLANHSLHSSPQHAGARLFMTISIPVGRQRAGESTDVVEVKEGNAPQQLSRETLLAEYVRWQRDEPVESRATVVDTLPTLSEVDEATLRAITCDYKSIPITALKNHVHDPKNYKIIELGTEQLAIIDRTYEAFLATVRQDAARHGLGVIRPSSCSVLVGIYRPPYDSLDWHVDAQGYPGARYVATIGDTGATEFGAGMIRRRDMEEDGFVPGARVGPDNPYRLVTHGASVISRFPANHGLHRTPPRGGFRLFMTATVVPDHPWPSNR